MPKFSLNNLVSLAANRKVSLCNSQDPKVLSQDFGVPCYYDYANQPKRPPVLFFSQNPTEEEIYYVNQNEKGAKYVDFGIAVLTSDVASKCELKLENLLIGLDLWKRYFKFSFGAKFGSWYNNSRGEYCPLLFFYRRPKMG